MGALGVEQDNGSIAQTRGRESPEPAMFIGLLAVFRLPILLCRDAVCENVHSPCCAFDPRKKPKQPEMHPTHAFPVPRTCILMFPCFLAVL